MFTGLSTELFTAYAAAVASLLALLASFLCLRWAILARDQAAACAQYVADQNKRSLSLKKMAEVETALTDLTDAYDSLLSQHKKMRARIVMREAREKKKQLGDAPAQMSDAEKSSEKARLRVLCKERGLLK